MLLRKLQDMTGPHAPIRSCVFYIRHGSERRACAGPSDWYNPDMYPADFASLPLSPILKTVAAELGFKALTPIQAESIPLLLQGKDVVGQSKTGSGKTAAFALPILERIRLESRDVQALILCPTR